MRKFFILILCLGCFSPIKAEADPIPSLEVRVNELTQMVKELKGVVETQQQEINLLRKNQETPPASIAPQYIPEVPKPSGKWMPEIGVVADTLLKLDSPKEDAEGADRISVREVELVLGSAVDPYTRLDVTLGISDTEAMEIEEAYATRFGLPFGMTARLGRFLPKIGKSIPVHLDSLDTVDEPMVIAKYFGHHGFSKSGLDLTKGFDGPFNAVHEATLGILEGGNGEEGTLFGESRRRPTLYGYLKNFMDLNDVSGLEVGFSWLSGSRDEDASFEAHVLGFDATAISRYADQQHLKIQSEAYTVSRSESHYELEDADTGELSFQDLDDARNLWGAYVLLDWKFAPQWATGFRWDDVQLIETNENFANPDSTESGYTGYLTFYQSEFARWRLQYTHVNLTSAEDDNRIFVQGTFAIGEHKHKIQ